MGACGPGLGVLAQQLSTVPGPSLLPEWSISYSPHSGGVPLATWWYGGGHRRPIPRAFARDAAANPQTPPYALRGCCGWPHARQLLTFEV